jgi:predicted Zn-dependent peptidase
LSIQTEVKAETTSIAVDEIFKEISRLSTKPVSNEELNTARNYLFGHFLRSMDGPFQISDRLQTVHPEGLLPEIYYSNYWNKAVSATPDDILNTVRKYLIPENMHVLIVGKDK